MRKDSFHENFSIKIRKGEEKISLTFSVSIGDKIIPAEVPVRHPVQEPPCLDGQRSGCRSLGLLTDLRVRE